MGTVTEIYDYLRLLWARVGTPHCPKCGREIRQQTVDQIVDQVLALPEGTQDPDPGARSARAEGRARQGVGGRAAQRLCPCAGGRQPVRLAEEITLEKNKKHHIEIVVDRLVVSATSTSV